MCNWTDTVECVFFQSCKPVLPVLGVAELGASGGGFSEGDHHDPSHCCARCHCLQRCNRRLQAILLWPEDQQQSHTCLQWVSMGVNKLEKVCDKSVILCPSDFLYKMLHDMNTMHICMCMTAISVNENGFSQTFTHTVFSQISPSYRIELNWL